MHVYCTVLSAGFRECLYRAVGFVCINCVCQIGSTVLKYMACLWSVVMLCVSLATRKVPCRYDISYIRYKLQCLYPKPNVSDLTLSLVLNIDTEEGVVCVVFVCVCGVCVCCVCCVVVCVCGV